MSAVDTGEAKLLTVLQKEFPVSVTPYDDIAHALDMEADQVVEVVQDLVDRRIIRRIGAVMNTKGLGFSSTLAAIKVPPRRLGEVAAIVSQYRGVTHNYARAHVVNLWFTMIAESSELLEFYLHEVEERTGLDVLRMPTLKLFKLGVKLDMNKKRTTSRGGRPRQDRHDKAKQSHVEEKFDLEVSGDLPGLDSVRTPETTARLQVLINRSEPYQKTSPDDRKLLARLQGNLAVSRHPFAGVANELGFEEHAVVERIGHYTERRWVRRLGVVLYHRRAGFTHNAMVGWIVPRDEVDEVGGALAAFESVSHCYERPVYPPDWPYNVFTMIHARSDAELRDIVADMVDTVGEYEHRALLSVHEFKKTSMEYF